MDFDTQHPETIVLHSGNYRFDKETNSVAVPIYQTTSYQFKNSEHAGDLFALKEFGNIYTRIMNPTTAVLEERIAALEGGLASLAVSSGQAAVALSLKNLCGSGDNIISSPHLYGGSWNLFSNTFKQLGIEVRFADPSVPESFRLLTDKNTRAYFAETLPNPKLTVFPIEEVSNIGAEYNIPLVASNDVRFIDKKDYQAHEVRVCINNGAYLKDEKRKSEYNDNQYFKSSQEMENLFSDIPSAIENTL